MTVGYPFCRRPTVGTGVLPLRLGLPEGHQRVNEILASVTDAPQISAQKAEARQAPKGGRRNSRFRARVGPGLLAEGAGQRAQHHVPLPV